MIRRALLVLAVAAVAASSASAALSPPDYRKQANAICAKANKALGALPTPNAASEVAGYLRKGLALQEPFIEALASLDPPAPLRALHDQAVSLKKQQAAAVEEALAKIEGGANAKTVITETSRKIALIKKVTIANFRKLGLTVCARLAAT